jgi:hypothetical protein
MKTKFASVLGLAVLAASFAFGSSLVYAETEETSSPMQVIALVADTNGAESELSCVLDSAGADICTDATKLAEVDQPSTAAGQTELSATEAPASTIHSVDAIAAEVNQTVTIAVPGENAADSNAVDSEEPAGTGSIMAPPAAEPVAMLDAGTTIEASEAPAIGAVDAIVVEVVQTVTVAVPGQDAGDSEEPAHTGSIPEATVEPVVMLDAKLLDDAN